MSEDDLKLFCNNDLLKSMRILLKHKGVLILAELTKIKENK